MIFVSSPRLIVSARTSSWRASSTCVPSFWDYFTSYGEISSTLGITTKSSIEMTFRWTWLGHRERCARANIDNFHNFSLSFNLRPFIVRRIARRTPSSKFAMENSLRSRTLMGLLLGDCLKISEICEFMIFRCKCSRAHKLPAFADKQKKIFCKDAERDNVGDLAKCTFYHKLACIVVVYVV